MSGALSPAVAQDCRPGSLPMARVELYFGGRPNDGRTWQKFLATIVTPRFPAGLTSLEGQGQWRGARGINRESSHILVIYYAVDATSDARIETIRDKYKRLLRQKSVLRVDSSACVGF